MSLMLIFLLFVLSLPIQGKAESIDGIDQARLAGQSFLSQNLNFPPNWMGASLKGVETYHDLQDRVITYLFSIEKDGQYLGHMVVGSSAYNFDVLEVGSGSYPSLPNSSELLTVLDLELGRGIKAESIGQPQLVYLGYASFQAIYQIGGESMAFDLQFRNIVNASKLESHILPSAEYREQKNDLRPQAYEYNCLDVPIQNMKDPRIPEDMRNNANCGPTSGAMVAEFYEYHRGYWNLYAWPYDHNRLYQTMGTNGQIIPGTMPWNAGPGFVTYAQERGYSFGTTYYGPSYNIMT